MSTKSNLNSKLELCSEDITISTKYLEDITIQACTKHKEASGS